MTTKKAVGVAIAHGLVGLTQVNYRKAHCDQDNWTPPLTRSRAAWLSFIAMRIITISS